MHVETLDQVAERLGWSAERLQQAREQAAEPRPSNVTDRDRARAKALSDSLQHTANALDEAS